MSTPDIRWDKGGEARVAVTDDDRVELLSTIPSAPGSRLDGSLEGGVKVRVKVARCRKVDIKEQSGEGALYRIEGRLLDASRSLRDILAKLAAAPTLGG